MKKYIKPELNIAEVELTTNLLGLSQVHDEYNSDDVSYTKEQGDLDIWDDEYE